MQTLATLADLRRLACSGRAVPRYLAGEALGWLTLAEGPSAAGNADFRRACVARAERYVSALERNPRYVPVGL